MTPAAFTGRRVERAPLPAMRAPRFEHQGGQLARQRQAEGRAARLGPAAEVPARVAPAAAVAPGALASPLARNAAEVWGDSLPDLAIWERRRALDARDPMTVAVLRAADRRGMTLVPVACDDATGTSAADQGIAWRQAIPGALAFLALVAVVLIAVVLIAVRF